jgi:lipoyl(octanoyl) transferase
MGKIDVQYIDLGLIDYKKAWDYQEEIFAHFLQLKSKNRDLPEHQQIAIENKLIFCEHIK